MACYHRHMPVEVDFISKVLQLGGPTAVSVFALLAWFFERKENKNLQEKLMQLSTACVTAMVKTEASVDSLTEAINRLEAHR